MLPTDSDLLDAFAREGTERSFLALYDRHAPAMYALAFRMMGGHHADAADVLQDAWMRVLPRLAQFRGDSSLRTWVCGFVVNCCRERFRGALFEELRDDAEHHVPERAAASVSLRILGAIDLERALAALPPGSRAVVVLHDVEGYTHREIAAALGIDEGTSKSQLSRGRAALRRRLDPSAGSVPPRAGSRRGRRDFPVRP
jgi:RNA polymerase sigma-70 factor, ECF subfamily